MKPHMLMLLAMMVSACESRSEAVADAGTETTGAAEGTAAELSGDVLVEDRGDGSITWKIAGDGSVKALVEVAERPVTRNVAGALVFKGKEDKTVPLGIDSKSGLLVAAGPKLEADLTEMAYTVTLEGTQWSGVLHLPRGGIAELVASAKPAAKTGVDSTTIGPHGGVVQVVGRDVFEIVAIEGRGDVRAYRLEIGYLDVIPIGDRKITVGVEGDTDGPKTAELVPEPELRLYASAKMKLKGDPRRITLAVRDGAKVSVALVGFKVRGKLLAWDDAPRLKIHVSAQAVADRDAELKAKLKK